MKNRNIQINNAYNIGSINVKHLDISSILGIGSIAGTNWSDLISFNNCYYLKGSYDVGVGGNGSSTGITEWDSIEDFPSVLSVVNGEGAFKEDTNNINNGYPILEWQ